MIILQWKYINKNSYRSKYQIFLLCLKNHVIFFKIWIEKVKTFIKNAVFAFFGAHYICFYQCLDRLSKSQFQFLIFDMRLMWI